MQHTLFDTPVVNHLLRRLSRLILRLQGWRVEGSLPIQASKSVIIGAPHTSNWDLPYMLMAAFVLHLHVYWLGKASLFRAPFGPLMRWLGGVPVDRSKSNNLVTSAAASIRAADGPLQLVLSPEGTRGRTERWKTGFYFIALEAKVPIVLAYIDYEHRVCGLGPLFVPTGDVDRDMLEIQRFYAGFRGRKQDRSVSG